jgi:hypothetical protein
MRQSSVSTTVALVTIMLKNYQFAGRERTRKEMESDSQSGPQAVPTRLSRNGRFGEGKVLGCGEGKETKSEARREIEVGLTAFLHNFDVFLGRAAFGKILMLIRVVTSGRNFDIYITRA